MKAQPPARTLNYIEYLVLAIYFVLCIILYQERTLFLDNAFQVFLLIQDENIVVNANRWPAVIVRVLPLICVKLGLSLKTILISFSLSYCLVQFAIYATVRWILKDRKNAFLILLLLIVPVAHSFFWCNSELIFGLSLMVLWVSLYDNKKFVGLSLLTLILPWVHPLLLLCFLFVMAYLFLEKGSDKKLVFLQGFLFVGMSAIKSVLFPNWYDNIKHQSFITNLNQFDITETHFIESFFQFEYIPHIFGIIAVVILCTLNKKYISCLLFLFFVLCFLVINDISTTDYSHGFYHEVSFLSIFFVVLFVGSRIVTLKQQPFVLALLFILLTFGFYKIMSTSKFYKERSKWIENKAHNDDRKILKFTSEVKEVLIMPWASSYESLIISTLSGQSKTFRYVMDVNAIEPLDSQDLIFMEYKSYTLDELNSDYFNLEPKPYSIKN